MHCGLVPRMCLGAQHIKTYFYIFEHQRNTWKYIVLQNKITNHTHVWPRSINFYSVAILVVMGIGDFGLSGCLWEFLHSFCTIWWGYVLFPSPFLSSVSLSSPSKGSLTKGPSNNLSTFIYSKDGPDNIFFLDWHVSLRETATFSSSPVNVHFYFTLEKKSVLKWKPTISLYIY